MTRLLESVLTVVDLLICTWVAIALLTFVTGCGVQPTPRTTMKPVRGPLRLADNVELLPAPISKESQ